MSAEELAARQAKADEWMRAHWHVKDGVLEFDGKGDSLCTARDYGDFELYVDWKITPAADSGIYLRGNPQVQIWDPDNEAAWKHGADKGSGGLWNNKHHKRFPLVKADRPAGEWNTMFIRMVGDRVTVKLNDQLVVDGVPLENYWQPEKPLPSTGSIELQNHGNTLWFRNIYVRELSE
jgi:3-keto-disaccharide hydrolase